MPTTRAAILAALAASLCATGCGRGIDLGLDNEMSPETRRQLQEAGALPDPDRETIFDLFQGNRDPDVAVEVNRYLWNASLEILDFLPVEAADPFSGIIAFGYGTPPGGGRAYRATVYVQDPALDARSLRVALQTRGGPVSREVSRQVEDAILTRARQLRIRDGRL